MSSASLLQLHRLTNYNNQLPVVFTTPAPSVPFTSQSPPPIPLQLPHWGSFKQQEKVFPGSQSLGWLVVGEPLQVVAQHSFGFKRLAAAAGVWPLAGVVELMDPQQRAGEEELSAGDAVVALLSGVFGSLVAQQRA